MTQSTSRAEWATSLRALNQAFVKRERALQARVAEAVQELSRGRAEHQAVEEQITELRRQIDAERSSCSELSSAAASLQVRCAELSNRSAELEQRNQALLLENEEVRNLRQLDVRNSSEKLATMVEEHHSAMAALQLELTYQQAEFESRLAAQRQAAAGDEQRRQDEIASRARAELAAGVDAARKAALAEAEQKLQSGVAACQRECARATELRIVEVRDNERASAAAELRGQLAELRVALERERVEACTAARETERLHAAAEMRERIAEQGRVFERERDAACAATREFERSGHASELRASLAEQRLGLQAELELQRAHVLTEERGRFAEALEAGVRQQRALADERLAAQVEEQRVVLESETLRRCALERQAEQGRWEQEMLRASAEFEAKLQQARAEWLDSEFSNQQTVLQQALQRLQDSLTERQDRAQVDQRERDAAYVAALEAERSSHATELRARLTEQHTALESETVRRCAQERESERTRCEQELLRARVEFEARLQSARAQWLDSELLVRQTELQHALQRVQDRLAERDAKAAADQHARGMRLEAERLAREQSARTEVLNVVDALNREVQAMHERSHTALIDAHSESDAEIAALRDRLLDREQAHIAQLHEVRQEHRQSMAEFASSQARHFAGVATAQLEQLADCRARSAQAEEDWRSRLATVTFRAGRLQQLVNELRLHLGSVSLVFPFGHTAAGRRLGQAKALLASPLDPLPESLHEHEIANASGSATTARPPEAAAHPTAPTVDTAAIQMPEINSEQAMMRDATNLDELLQLDDEAFVRSAYALVLGRVPDPIGFDNYLRKIREGAEKSQIVTALALSPEGQAAAPVLAGLDELLRKKEQRRRASWLGRFFKRAVSEAQSKQDAMLRAIGNRLAVVADRQDLRDAAANQALREIERRLADVRAEQALALTRGDLDNLAHRLQSHVDARLNDALESRLGLRMAAHEAALTSGFEQIDLASADLRSAIARHHTEMQRLLAALPAAFGQPEAQHANSAGVQTRAVSPDSSPAHSIGQLMSNVFAAAGVAHSDTPQGDLKAGTH